MKAKILMAIAILFVSLTAWAATSFEGTETIKVNESKTITLRSEGTNVLDLFAAQPPGIEYIWYCSNTSIATVTYDSYKSCTLKGIAEGTCEIHLSVNFFFQTNQSLDFCWNVTVAGFSDEGDPSIFVKPTDVVLTPTKLELEVGQTYEDMSFTVYPSNATYTYEWVCYQPNIVTVSKIGVLTAVAPGTAIVSIWVYDNEGICNNNTVKTCEVTVTEPVVTDPEAYAVYKDSVLTFYYDNTIDSREGEIYKSDNFRNSKYNGWRERRSEIKKVVFDVSFSEYNGITSTAYWFEDCVKLEEIIGLANLNTANDTDMRNMFTNCSSLVSLDLCHFNTSQVTSMSYMFYGCSSLTSLDLGNFDTSKVTNMSSMFRYCSHLTSLDLSNFNTNNVTKMSYMFPGCHSLTSLDLSNFDTSKVTDMSYFFSDCSSLASLNLSNFDTSKVTSMSSMFQYCSHLTSLDLSNFNTNKVTAMSNMFSGCSSLTSLDIGNFNTSNVTNMYSMFRGCSSLTSLDLNNFNTSNVIDMSYMFSGCSSLTSLDIDNFNTSNVTNMYSMFNGCSSLTSLDLSHFDTSKVTDMSLMFYDCKSIMKIVVSDLWNVEKVTGGDSMFSNCYNLVGGAGTTYDSNHTDVTYAHIDGGPSNPGYLTKVGSDPDTQIYEYYIVIWLNDGTKVEYKYDENLVIRCEVGKLSITTKNGIVDYALRNIKEITLSKKTEDGSIIPISPSETENAGIVIYKNNGSQIEITADRVKNIMLYMEKTHQGHGYTDLGLDTYWATCNIGADAPEGKGYYFSWGETQPKKTYDENTYKFGYPPAKYNDKDGLTQLLPADDAAHVYWGGQWRLPTRVEENELYNMCEWTWTNVNGVDGFTVTGPNGNSIFLPTTGLYDGDSTTELKRSNTGGWYWSSTTNGSNFACGICFPTPNNLYMNVPNHERWDGHAIRPVVNGADVSESFGIIIYLVDGSEIKIPREELDKITAYFVTSTIQGDVNGDVVVDVADIATIISVMAGDGVGTGHVPTQGDVNGDGVVDVADIATIISIMAGNTSDDDTEPENAIHPESPYDYVKGEIPNISESQLMVTISTNAEALPGGAVIINASANTLIECFYIAISGQPGYYIKYPETPTPNGGNYIYRFPLLFPQDWDHDIVVKVCGLTKDGRFFVCQELPIRYHAAGTGALQVSLTFDNAKDIDLHLFTPGGTHYYYGNKGYSKTYENGEVVYVGLDIDSNPGCNIDNINCENITLPEDAIEEGTYKVFVNMYSNCNTNIATGWTCVATRGGQLVSNQITGYGNPASGVYPVGQRNHDMTEVMRFNVERASKSRASQSKRYIIKPVPIDEFGIMKLEEEKARINNQISEDGSY